MKRAVPVLMLAAFAGVCLAQAPEFVPKLDMRGKDISWIPTAPLVADKMMEVGKVTPADYVIDLGSGDGVIVIAAAKRGARALGVEFNPDLVELSRRNAQKAGVAGRASFVKADMFTYDYSKATVITLFMGERMMVRVRPMLLALKPGTRVLSNTGTMGQWEEDGKAVLTPAQGCEGKYCTVFLWFVPAQAAGKYKLPQGDLVLEQEFQLLSGTLAAGGETHPVQGRVRGYDVSFKAGGKEYRGRMNGKKLELQ